MSQELIVVWDRSDRNSYPLSSIWDSYVLPYFCRSMNHIWGLRWRGSCKEAILSVSEANKFMKLDKILLLLRGTHNMSRYVKLARARYERGVLKLLEPVDLEEGEEVIVRIEKPRERDEIIERYKGFMGEIDEEELERLIEEAELEKL